MAQSNPGEGNAGLAGTGVTTMTSGVSLEILDLRHFSGSHLRPLLESEGEVWRGRLHWDYGTSAKLLLQYLDSRMLPGYAALENGRVTGYTFCVYEETKAVIGDVFAVLVRRAGGCELQRPRLAPYLADRAASKPHARSRRTAADPSVRDAATLAAGRPHRVAVAAPSLGRAYRPVSRCRIHAVPEAVHGAGPHERARRAAARSAPGPRNPPLARR